jgi:hypothetical protein
MYYRHMMVLTSGALETCTRALGTCELSCTGRPARLFFMFEICSPQGTAGRMIAQSPPYSEVGYGATGHVMHRSPPTRSRATIHVVEPDPSLQGGRIRSHRTHGASVPYQRVRSHGTHGGVRALLIREVESKAVGHAVHRSIPSGSRAMIHMAAPKPFLSGKRDLEPLDTWQFWNPPWLGSRVRYCRARGSAWVHAPLPVLT